MPFCLSAIVSSTDVLTTIEDLNQQLTNMRGHCQCLKPQLASHLGYQGWSDLIADSKLLVRRDDFEVMLRSLGIPADPDITVMVDSIFRTNCRPSIYAPKGVLLGCAMVGKDDLRFDPRLYSTRGSCLKQLFKLPGSACSADAWDEFELGMIRRVGEYQAAQPDEIQELVTWEASRWLEKPVAPSKFLRNSSHLLKAVGQCRSEREVRRALAQHYEPHEHSATSLDELFELAVLMADAVREADKPSQL